MKITLFTWQFWESALARSIRTFAQGAMGAQTGSMFGWWHMDPKSVLGMGLSAAWYSLMMSIDRSGKGSDLPPGAPGPFVPADTQ